MPERLSQTRAGQPLDHAKVVELYPCPEELADRSALLLAHQAQFERIYQEQFPFVWRSLGALGVTGPGRDDAAQDVFLVVYRRLGEFQGRSSLRTWIFAIVEHVAFNHRRADRRKRSPLTRLDEAQSSDEPDPFERAQDREIAEFLEHFLNGLRAEQRLLFVFVLVEQMSAPEVAEVLGIPLNTAYTRIRAIKQAFRKAAAARQEPMP
ncbi:MAG: sigma-70 family RNA polymerase sigma factor [Polyangiaceae bacterium]|nr:sigma-70 family RNA polymerase sigma factor [Polyangiaceae bacterium]